MNVYEHNKRKHKPASFDNLSRGQVTLLNLYYNKPEHLARIAINNNIKNGYAHGQESPELNLSSKILLYQVFYVLDSCLSCFNPGKRQNLLQTCALTKAAIARTFRFPAQKRNSSLLSSICAVAFQGHTTCAHYLVGQPPAISCKFEMS